MLHILETVKTLAERGVTLVSVTYGIDSSTAAGRMMIGVLGSLAENERELVKERTALKLKSSRANGTKFGRPLKVDDVAAISTAARMRDDGHAAKDIAKFLGVSRPTMYRYLALKANARGGPQSTGSPSSQDARPSHVPRCPYVRDPGK